MKCVYCLSTVNLFTGKDGALYCVPHFHQYFFRCDGCGSLEEQRFRKRDKEIHSMLLCQDCYLEEYKDEDL